jgi:pimeloyl-ACP methyl ester carboxylesterase
MRTLLILIVVALAVPVLLYFLAPRVVFNAARATLRRKGGLVSKTIRVGDLDWPYLEGGDPAGVPLVLVHGFGGDKDNWAFYAPYLKGPYRLIFPDLPGFGDTVRHPELNHSGAAQAERLGHFLEALGIERCHLGGNSMGGYIALLFALAQPNRLRSLTLFNNAGVLGTQPSDLQAMIEAEPGASPLVPRSPDELRELLTFVVFRPRPIPGRFLAVLYNDFAAHRLLLDRIFAQLADDMLNHPLNDRLGEVAVPTLIVWGRHDRLIDVTSAEVQHQGIAGSELVVFEDVGHVPMMEQPARTAQHHLPFLAKH